MTRRESAVGALNRLLVPEGLRLRINKERRIDRGFYYIERIGSGEVVRRNVDLSELGRYLRTAGALPPPRPGEEDIGSDDDNGPVLPSGPLKPNF